jgi:hypothetical protein
MVSESNEPHLLGISPDVLALMTDRVGPADLAAFAQTSKTACQHVRYTKFMVFRKACVWDLGHIAIPFNTASACTHAAIDGNLPMLKWLRESGCAWDARTLEDAIRLGHLETVKWATAQRPPCPWPSSNLWSNGACDMAIMSRASNALELLKWLVTQGCSLDTERSLGTCIIFENSHMLQFLHDSGCTADEGTIARAAEGGDLDVVKWLRVELNCDWNSETCSRAAQKGHLHVLKWAHENGCEWDGRTVKAALQNKLCHWRLLKYVRDNNCPMHHIIETFTDSDTDSSSE